jgi:hypothetical protein
VAETAAAAIFRGTNRPATGAGVIGRTPGLCRRLEFTGNAMSSTPAGEILTSDGYHGGHSKE